MTLTKTVEWLDHWPVWNWLQVGRDQLRTPVTVRPTRWQVAGWVAVVVTATSLALLDYDSFQVGAYRDDAIYILLARSLVHGPSYGLLNLPGTPVAPGFPFGWPLLLTPFEILFPNNIQIFPVGALAATWVNLTLLFWGWPWLNRGSSYWWGLVVTALYGLSPLTVGHTRVAMSEPAFLTAGLVAMLLIERYPPQFNRFGWLLMLAVALVFTIFTRTVGVTFVLAILIHWLYVHGRSALRPMLGLGLAFVGVLGVLILVTPLSSNDLLGPNARYLIEYQNFVDGSVRNPRLIDRPYTEVILLMTERRFIRGWRPILLPIGGGLSEQLLFERWGIPWAYYVINYGLVGLAVMGGLHQLKKSGPALFWTAALVYYFAISLWNSATTRFLYPIQPQIYFATAVGAYQLYLWLITKARSLRLAARVGLALALLSWLAILGYKSSTLDDSRTHLGDIALRTAWLKDHSPPESVLMTEVPDFDHLYSQRHTIGYPVQTLAASPLLEYLRANRVNYVLVAPFSLWQEVYVPSLTDEMYAWLPTLTSLSDQGYLRKVYESPPDLLTIYQVTTVAP